MAKSDDLSTKKIVTLTENDEVPGSKFTSCPEDYTVYQLKCWLKCRGSKQSGKRQELITLSRTVSPAEITISSILELMVENG